MKNITPTSKSTTRTHITKTVAVKKTGTGKSKGPRQKLAPAPTTPPAGIPPAAQIQPNTPPGTIPNTPPPTTSAPAPVASAAPAAAVLPVIPATPSQWEKMKKFSLEVLKTLRGALGWITLIISITSFMLLLILMCKEIRAHRNAAVNPLLDIPTNGIPTNIIPVGAKGPVVNPTPVIVTVTNIVIQTNTVMGGGTTSSALANGTPLITFSPDMSVSVNINGEDVSSQYGHRKNHPYQSANEVQNDGGNFPSQTTEDRLASGESEVIECKTIPAFGRIELKLKKGYIFDARLKNPQANVILDSDGQIFEKNSTGMINSPKKQIYISNDQSDQVIIFTIKRI